jgi:hypothetical protein
MIDLDPYRLFVRSTQPLSNTRKVTFGSDCDVAESPGLPCPWVICAIGDAVSLRSVKANAPEVRGKKAAAANMIRFIILSSSESLRLAANET